MRCHCLHETLSPRLFSNYKNSFLCISPFYEQNYTQENGARKSDHWRPSVSKLLLIVHRTTCGYFYTFLILMRLLVNINHRDVSTMLTKFGEFLLILFDLNSMTRHLSQNETLCPSMITQHYAWEFISMRGKLFSICIHFISWFSVEKPIPYTCAKELETPVLGKVNWVDDGFERSQYSFYHQYYLAWRSQPVLTFEIGVWKSRKKVTVKT